MSMAWNSSLTGAKGTMPAAERHLRKDPLTTGLQHWQLRRLLPGGAGAAGVEIRLDLREAGKAETGLLDDVEDRAIGAIDQAELAAQKPFVLCELAFEGAEHRRERLLAAGDHCLVGGDSGHARTNPQCNFAGRRHDMLREEEEPLQGLRASGG